MATDLETCYRHPGEPTRIHCTRCERPICPDCMTPAPVGHHCPVCVGEAARESRRLQPRFRRPRSVTATILALNLGIFAADILLGATSGVPDPLLRRGAMVPILIANGEWWRLFTAMFLHIGILHIAFNSFALYMFGGLIEGALGSARFLAIYLTTGFVAGAASYTLSSPGTAAAGASGAIFGLLGAWLVYNLRRRSLSLARSNIQGALMLIAINLAFGFAVPGIDNTAHLGGLAAGLVAGVAAEGVGRGGMRLATQVGGFALLIVVALALVVTRTSSLLGAT